MFGYCQQGCCTASIRHLEENPWQRTEAADGVGFGFTSCSGRENLLPGIWEDLAMTYGAGCAGTGRA